MGSWGKRRQFTSRRRKGPVTIYMELVARGHTDLRENRAHERFELHDLEGHKALGKAGALIYV